MLFRSPRTTRDVLVSVIVPKNAKGVVYLSQRNQSTDFPVLTCAVANRNGRYGDKEFSCLDQLRTSRVLLDSFRQGAREKQILTVLESLFPECDPDRDVVFCGGNEEKIFEVVTHGVEELATIGDVFCTKRFKSVNVVRRAKVSVGVSVSSGLLDLDVSTDELSQDELAELLKHYKSHQRYYRFKSGEEKLFMWVGIKMFA